MDIPCLRDISLNETGPIASNFAISARAITAYLPLDVSFIIPHFKGLYIYPTKLVKYSKYKTCFLTLNFDRKT